MSAKKPLIEKKVGLPASVTTEVKAIMLEAAKKKGVNVAKLLAEIIDEWIENNPAMYHNPDQLELEGLLKRKARGRNKYTVPSQLSHES